MQDDIITNGLDYRKFDEKLILLCLFDAMDLPLSYNQIMLYATDETRLELFLIQQNLNEMTQSGYIDKFHSNNDIRYMITEEGANALEYFSKHIPKDARDRIDQFVTDNRKEIKKDYNVIASHAFDYTYNEYQIRCGVYEDESTLMEVTLYVVSKEQAQFICDNWKGNVQYLYANMLNLLTTDPGGVK